MIRQLPVLLLSLFLAAVPFLAAAPVAAAQQEPRTLKAPEEAPQPDDPVANPGRPTVATPATLTPVGYFQFETGFLGAKDSPGFSSQPSINEVVKFSVSRWIELLAVAEPFVHSTVAGQPADGTGDVSLGVQGVVHHGEGANPTLAVSYFRRVYNGGTPDLDIGSAGDSALVLASAEVKSFHYDINFFFNAVSDTAVHRAQFGQTLSVSYPLGKKFGVSGEIWHFTQPFLRSNAVGNLWVLNYNVRKNLVLDGGFNRGLTSTSTQWEVFVGFTYLLPHKILRP